MCALIDYKALSERLNGVPYVESIYKQFTDTNNKSDCNVDINLVKCHLDTENGLSICLHNIGEYLRSVQEKNITLPELDEKRFYLYIYLMLQEPDYPTELLAPSVQALDVLMLYININFTENYLYTDDLSKKIFSYILTSLIKRVKHNQSIPIRLMVDFNNFIQKHYFHAVELNKIVDFLLELIATHNVKITNFTNDDANSPSAVRGFDCLKSLLTKAYPEQAQKESTRFYILQKVGNVMYQVNSGRTLIQHSILKHNVLYFTVYIMSLLHNKKSLIARIMCYHIKNYTHIRTLVDVMNQLPFCSYKVVVYIHLKMLTHEYSKNVHAFLFHLFENPYITAREDYIKQLGVLQNALITAIIDPMQKPNLAIAIATMEYIDSFLQFRNLNTLLSIKKFLRSGGDIKLLNLVYQYCHPDWYDDRKIINQYFIKIFFRLNSSTARMAVNGREQFICLFNTADVVDLIPCLPIIAKYLQAHFSEDLVLTKRIVNKFIDYAICPHFDSKLYIKELNKLFFMDPSMQRIQSCKKQISKFVNGFNPYLEILLQKMVTQKFLTFHVVEQLIDHLLNGRECWLLLLYLLPQFQSVPMPKTIVPYWQEVFLRNPPKDDELVYLLTTFCKLTEVKSQWIDYEIRICTCLLEQLIFEIRSRRVPINMLGLSLTTINKLIIVVNYKLPDFLKLYSEIELELRIALSEFIESNGDYEKLTILTRELAYFGQLTFMYGDRFEIKQSTLKFFEGALKLIAIDDLHNLNGAMARALLQCCTHVGIRNMQLQSETVCKLRYFLKSTEADVKALAIHCLYDLTLCQTRNYGMLIPHLHDFLLMDSPYLRAEALKIYTKLIDEDHILPKNWQMFVIMYTYSEKSVNLLCKYSMDVNFVRKHENIFTKYFVHFILYFNKCYNYEKYSLCKVVSQQIPHHGIPMEEKFDIYVYFLRKLSKEGQFQIMHEIIDNVLQKYDNFSVGYPLKFDILQDVFLVTYIIMRQNNSNYPKNDKTVYESTIAGLSSLKDVGVKHVYDVDEDDALVEKLMRSLKHILNKLVNDCRFIVPDLFHVIMAICHWYSFHLMNAVGIEGPEHQFRNIMLSISGFYEKHKYLFHFEKPMHMLPSLLK